MISSVLIIHVNVIELWPMEYLVPAGWSDMGFDKDWVFGFEQDARQQE